MKNKKLTSSLVFFFFLAISSYFIIDQLLPKPYHERKLDMILTLSSKDDDGLKKAEQIRSFGKKELYSGSDERRKTELRYGQSVLSLDKSFLKNSLSEKIQDVVVIKEDGDQIYTVMEAKSAYITFETGEISAHDVLLKRLKSKSFPECSFDHGILFVGTAQNAKGSLIGENKGMIAHDLKGRFFQEP